jgi:hypothetical protein
MTSDRVREILEDVREHPDFVANGLYHATKPSIAMLTVSFPFSYVGCVVTGANHDTSVTIALLVSTFLTVLTAGAFTAWSVNQSKERDAILEEPTVPAPI